jgi:myo-inositol-1(or 4)-monophosphatase
MATDHLSIYTQVAIQAALQAGEIILQGFGTTYEVIEKPGHQNYVTVFDHLSEKAIVDKIQANFPSHQILTEESGWISSPHSTPGFTWIIDPLDGTTNFTRQIPLFTVSIALYHEDQALCGVIYQPLTQELFVAEKNKGAYLNNKRLKVSDVKKLEASVIAVGLPYENNHPTLNINHLTALNQLGTTIRNLGSAALALAYVSAGKIDGFWMPYLYAWDLAAGKLLIEEAQGQVTSYALDNSLFPPSGILASNFFLHEKLLPYITQIS